MDPQERRRQILDRSGEIFATKGISATTVREIADACGVYSGTLYHYFPSKDAIAEVIVTRYLDDLTSEYESLLGTPTDPRKQLTGLVEASFRVSRAHPHASEIYQNNTTYLRKLAAYQKIRAAARTTKNAWISVIEGGIAAGEFRSDLPAEVLYGLIRDAVWLSLRWFTPTPEFGIDQLAAAVVSVFLEGIESRH